MGHDARQLAILAAIGIDVYCLRGPEPAAAPPGAGELAADAAAVGGATDVRLVIATSAGLLRDRRMAQRVAQLARAIGAAPAQTRTVDVGADGAALPDAPAYLMIGAAAARACSAQMPIARQQAAAIAVVDDLAAIGGGAVRRVLWQTLKPLAWRVRAAAR